MWIIKTCFSFKTASDNQQRFSAGISGSKHQTYQNIKKTQNIHNTVNGVNIGLTTLYNAHYCILIFTRANLVQMSSDAAVLQYFFACQNTKTRFSHQDSWSKYGKGKDGLHCSLNRSATQTSTFFICLYLSPSSSQRWPLCHSAWSYQWLLTSRERALKR